MKRTSILALLIFLVAGLLRAEDLPWQDDYDKALAAAKEQHKPVLLDFCASWCGPCHLLETTTFADSTVQTSLTDYILVKIDFDQNPALVGKYGVHAIPACIVLNQFGEKVAEQVGYANATDFDAWLTVHASAAAVTVSKMQVALNRVKTLGGGLERPNADARNRAMTSLMDVYTARDANDDGQGAKLVEQELRGYVQRHPADALARLADPRLAVRILFAGLLAEKLGADFSFDPWAKADARAADVAVWTKKLENG